MLSKLKLADGGEQLCFLGLQAIVQDVNLGHHLGSNPPFILWIKLNSQTKQNVNIV